MFALPFILLSAASASAGSEGGNGGDAVVCRSKNGKIRSARLLDFLESRSRPGMSNIDLGGPSLSYLEKVSLALDRYVKLSPRRGDTLRSWSETFVSEADFPEGVALTDIPDSKHIQVPRGCALEQLAIQQEPVFPGDKRYTINQDIWADLSEDDKAGLVMHELLYREAMSEGATDSTGVRYLNSVLCTNKAMTQRDFASLLKSMSYANLGWPEQYPLDLFSSYLEFYPDGKIKRGAYTKDVTYAFAGGSADGRSNPVLELGDNDAGGRSSLRSSTNPRGRAQHQRNFIFTFTPAGEVNSIELEASRIASSDLGSIEVHASDFTAYSVKSLKLHPNFAVRELAAPVYFELYIKAGDTLVATKQVDLRAGKAIFDQNGHLTHFSSDASCRFDGMGALPGEPCNW